ncbi:MAG: helix-turn-helix domain-containing protein [Solirubrobacterales bacterium]
MEKELLEECLAEGMSLEAIGKQVGKHESTVSYWLKKHGLAAARAEKHASKDGTASCRWSIAAGNCSPAGSELGDDPTLDGQVRIETVTAP